MTCENSRVGHNREMLRTLRIKNLALVEELVWEPGAGFTAITGETGAGKSIIIGALMLVLGERADKGCIRTGEEQCSVEAEWDLTRYPNFAELEAWLEENGLDKCEDGMLRVKRQITLTSGRQFVNGSPASLQNLRDIGVELADFHGPHEHQSLLSNETQRLLLDRFAGFTSDINQTREAWKKWKQAGSERAQAESESGMAPGELELLEFQADEISAATLRLGEDIEMSEAISRARNSKRVLELGSLLGECLDGEGESISDKMAVAHRTVSELASLDKQCVPLMESLDQAAVLVREAAADLTRYLEKLDLDPARLSQVEERYNLVQTLIKKYGGSIGMVLDYESKARERLARYENRDLVLSELKLREESARQEYGLYASELSRKRKIAAEKLAPAVMAQLRDLGFKSALLEVQVRMLTQPCADGFDEVEIQFAPNPGEGSKPLKAIASSGEMARVMLAVKTCLAAQDQVPLLVFDEVDANVGGEIGTQVGKKLRALGGSHQVLCITHLPQVAALGQEHYQVLKETSGGRTFTKLIELDGEERCDELARMLGGVSHSTKKLAKAMLKGG